MTERIFLSTYTLRITNRKREYELPERFNGSDDFFNFFVDYCQHLYQNVQKDVNEKEGYEYNFTIEDLGDNFLADKDSREIYGYFKAGITGDRFEVTDKATGEVLIRVNPRDHINYKYMFFYIYMPKSKDTIYVILQKRAKFGVKTKFKISLKQFFRQHDSNKGLDLKLYNRLPLKVFRRMIKDGKLKQVSFIQQSIPRTLAGLFERNTDEKLRSLDGEQVRTLKSRDHLPDQWKEDIYNWWTNRNEQDKRIDIPITDEEFDEISYTLNLEGKETTFYMKQEHRTQPDIDVTRNLKFDKNEEPVYESLITEARSLLDLVMTIGEKDV